MNLGKSSLLGLTLVCVLASNLSAGPAVSVSPGVPPASVQVSNPPAVSELAAGYAAAVEQMTLKGIVIYYQEGSAVTAIKGLRSVQALNGVLLVTFSAGDVMALNAERILLITDGTRPAERGSGKS